LYRDGASNGSNILAVGILRMVNLALGSLDQFEEAVVAVLNRLRSLLQPRSRTALAAETQAEIAA